MLGDSERKPHVTLHSTFNNLLHKYNFGIAFCSHSLTDSQYSWFSWVWINWIVWLWLWSLSTSQSMNEGTDLYSTVTTNTIVTGLVRV